MNTTLSKIESLSGTLSRDEMKNITAGSGTCGYRDADGYGYCNLSKNEAQFFAEAGGYWCCDSCASNGGGASYC
ncbi:hypothetical protein ABWH96_03230 [Marivirga tractuosa]|uniref:hypothetical protein n=1 Tax=Marivirga tractuosa TaxID=1006 RepID=UPI0035CFB17C